MAVGDLIALPERYSDRTWLYRVVRMTPTRSYVEAVEKPEGRWLSDPSAGSREKWIDIGRGVAIRDMDHWAVVKEAYRAHHQSISDIKSVAKQKAIAADERLKAAIA